MQQFWADFLKCLVSTRLENVQFDFLAFGGQGFMKDIFDTDCLSVILNQFLVEGCVQKVCFAALWRTDNEHRLSLSAITLLSGIDGRQV